MNNHPFRAGRLLRILSLIFLSTSGLWAQEKSFFPESHIPELEAILQEAAVQSGELEIKDLQIEQREGDLKVARGGRLPQANLYTRLIGVYETREDIEDTTRGTVNANFNISQPIYHWGNLKRRENIAEDRVEMAKLDKLDKAEMAFSDLRENYLRWLLSERKLENLHKSVEISRKILEGQREMEAIGEVSEQEILEMEARLLESEESLAHAEREVKYFRNRVQRYVGKARLDDQVLEADIEDIELIEPRKLEEIYEKLNGGGRDFTDYSLQQFEHQESIEEAQLEILDKEHYPTFDFVTGVFSDRLDGLNQRDSVIRIQYFAGVQVRWNIFDGWQTEGRRLSTLARKRTQEIRKSQQEERLEDETNRTLAELQLNLKQIEARGKRAEILERRVALLNRQAERETISGLDRLEGELNFREVKQRLLEARINYLINLMKLGSNLYRDPAIYYLENAS